MNTRPCLSFAVCVATWAAMCASPALAVDLESFEFADSNGTELTAAANTANPGNTWSYDEEGADTSSVQSGAYRVITNSESTPSLIESRYLDIDNVSSGTLFLEVEFRSWRFNAGVADDGEEIRFAFITEDNGTSGNTVTSQVQIARENGGSTWMLEGNALGTAGSFNIANAVEVAQNQTQPFTMVLALDKDSNSYEVFYRDGSGPSQVLGLGGVSRVRDANSIRFATENLGRESAIPGLAEDAFIERIALSTTNPFDDLISLEVDRATGGMTLINTSGAAVSGVTSLTLESTSGAIDLTDFTDFSGTLAIDQTVQLDSMPGNSTGIWVQNPVEDLRAELVISGGEVRTLDVNFVGNGGVKLLEGDLNANGIIDAADYAILAANAETDLTGLTSVQAYKVGDLNDDGFNDVRDFNDFKQLYIDANGPAAFAQLIAGVPEPSGAALCCCGAVLVGIRRRRYGRDPIGVKPTNRRTPSTMSNIPSRIRLAAVAALMLATCLTTRSAQAVIFEDFLFDDPAGTPLTGVANEINDGVTFDEDTDTVGVTTNGLGQLDASLKDNFGFGTNYVDVEPAITSGTVYGIMELTWDMQGVFDAGEPEQFRLSLVNSNPRSTEITSEFRIERTSDGVAFYGIAGGPSDTQFHIGQTILNEGSLSQTDKFIAVVAADLDASSYEILYSTNAGGSFLSGGTAPFPTGRVVESMRLTLNNNLSDDSVLIDRIYLTDELPFVLDPDKLTLYVHPTSGFVSIVNATGTEFDIDHYRVRSADGSLLDGNWRSLQDQALDAVDGPDGGATAGDGAGETWTEAGGADEGVLAESFLLSSSVVEGSEVLPLGRVFDLSGDEEQLTFEYRDAVTGSVFVGDVVLGELDPGDYNLDGRVDAADYTVFRDNATGLFVAGDYTTWSNNHGSVFDASASTAQAVPEPAALALVGCVAIVAAARRRG